MVGYYRPPNFSNVPRFLTHLESVLSDHSGRNCVILGDVNFNLLADRLSGFCNISSHLACFGFGLCNDRVTRSIKVTLLDHVLSNFAEEHSHVSATIEVDFSDHAGVLSIIHTAIYEILDRIFLNIDDGLAVSALFLDLQKAFDCVDHDILIHKLSRAGIRGVPLDLIRSYLSGRKQCVVIGDARSPYVDVSIGVPQGSVLGPILLNDVHRLPTAGMTTLFADDTGVIYSVSSTEENVDRMNGDLAMICCENVCRVS